MSHSCTPVITETIALSLPPLTRQIDLEVRSGQLAYLLGRPCSYVLYHFAQYLGERLVRLIVNIPVAFTIALIFVGPPPFTWMGLLAWPVVVLLAMSIDFVVYFSVGLLAFWTEETPLKEEMNKTTQEQAVTRSYDVSPHSLHLRTIGDGIQECSGAAVVSQEPEGGRGAAVAISARPVDR